MFIAFSVCEAAGSVLFHSMCVRVEGVIAGVCEMWNCVFIACVCEDVEGCVFIACVCEGEFVFMHVVGDGGESVCS